MAAAIPLISAPVLSQKQRRAALRKERRRRKRQALAQARENGLKNEAAEEEEANDEDGENNDEDGEEERLREHERWLERERLAQEEFRLRTEREEAARKRKEEEERLIKEEWETQQRREQEEEEQRQQEKRDREEAVQKMLDEAENQLDRRGPWMNPEAPAAVSSENFGTERDVANCPFFLKTGACRFGDRCSRKHVYPTSSPTLLIRGMFVTFGMEESRRDDYDMDACLEHSEEDLRESFLEFYRDVLPEFKSVGRVVQFKVCCNHEPHLRGNVYVQFDTEEQCREAFIRFNGRWYAGRQLQCETCPVTRWKSAICGLFDRQKCPKGKHCNFLHVFRNPGNEFWEADRDLQLSPDRGVTGRRRDERRSERFSERSWRRWRRYSRSPERSERSHRHREDRRTSRPRHEDGRRRSGDGPRHEGGDKRRDRHEEEDADGETSGERRKKRSREKSSEKTETNSHRHHKHAKKNKKSKKKRKKKSSASSGESGNERESEESENNPEPVVLSSSNPDYCRL